jgi:hypothetical protein
MTHDEFVTEVIGIAERNGVTPGQMASALIGIVVGVCRLANEDPRAFMEWAIATHVGEGLKS